MADIIVTYEDFTGAIKVDKFDTGQHVVEIGSGGVLAVRSARNRELILKVYSLNVWKIADLAE